MKKSINKKPKLKLINYKGTLGYALSNIKEVFDEKEFAKFQDWIDGQTVMVYGEDKLVYDYDFEKYLLGLPVTDQSFLECVKLLTF